MCFPTSLPSRKFPHPQPARPLTDLLSVLQPALASTYRLERQLGRGGMATVFLAHDLRHDRPVALKVLHPELAQTLGTERFEREIRLAARLQHPHILSVHDSGAAAGQLYFTMPFVEGESLRDRLTRERQLPVEVALRIATEAARALEYAHRHGVIHRDIKPENLLLTADGSTLVADFGIAHALAAGADRLTQTGMAIGTPAYMSPEQAAGDRALDARTDVYSLGAVVYEMLAGEPPFTGPTAQAIIARRMTTAAPRLRETRPSVPEPVEQAVARALSPLPADRFESAEAFGRALAQAAPAGAGATVTSVATVPSGATVPATAARAARYRPPAGVLLLGIGFLLGLGVLFAWRRSHTEAATGERRIAVLPFQNLGDSSEAYFADGITDAVRGKLTAVPGMRVTASNSSAEYRASTRNPRDIGRELGVDYLLVGKVRWARNADGTSRVQVSPELIQVATAESRWQQPFDAALTDVFQVQADIAGRVAGALQVALADSARQRLQARPTTNLAAYDAYLRGREVATDGSSPPQEVRRALGYYERAVALDSGFALAWAAVSRMQSALYSNSVPTPEAAEGARKAAERALGLGPELPESWLAQGTYVSLVQNDAPRAAEVYRSGLRLAPDHVDLLNSSALNDMSLGQWDSAVVSLKRAAALDPRSFRTSRRLGLALRRLKRYDEAQAELDRGLAVAPREIALREQRVMVDLGRGNLEAARAVIAATPPEVDPVAQIAYFGTYWDLDWALDPHQQDILLRLTPADFADDRSAWGVTLAHNLWRRGERARARAFADSARVALEAQLRATPGDPQRHVILGVVLAYLGQKADAIREGEQGVAMGLAAGDGYSASYYQHQLLRIYLAVDQPDKALDVLEPLLSMPYDLSPGWLRIDPTFAPLRGNPRFEQLLK